MGILIKSVKGLTQRFAPFTSGSSMVSNDLSVIAPPEKRNRLSPDTAAGNGPSQRIGEPLELAVSVPVDKKILMGFYKSAIFSGVKKAAG